MNNFFKLDKKQIEVYSKIIGFGCLFIVLFNQSSKSYRFIPQEISFWISIIGIIFLSINLNLKVKGKNDDNLNFFQRNTPLILGLTMAIAFAIFWITNNYISF